MKEALLKLTGEGIRNDIKDVLTGQESFETVENTERGYIYSILYAGETSRRNST